MCRVASDYNKVISSKDTRTPEEKCFELPDGSVIQLSLEATYKPAEILFQPSIRGSEDMSLP